MPLRFPFGLSALTASTLALTACVSAPFNVQDTTSEPTLAHMDAHPISDPAPCPEDVLYGSPPPVPLLPSQLHATPEPQTLVVQMGSEKLCNPNAPKPSSLWGVLHREKNKQHLFVPVERTAESQKILRCYQETYADALPTQLVSVHSPETFARLLSQSGPGPGVGEKGRDYDWRAFYLFSFDSRTADASWKTLPRNRILDAWNKIPTQTEKEQPNDHHWSCGPSSGARAILLWGYSLGESFESFRSRCPKSFGKPQTEGGQIASKILSAFTLGLSDSVVNNLPDVGPDLSALANYLTSRLPHGKSAKRYQYSSFLDCARDIKKDIDYKDPVIAFFVYKWNAMHYANLVGVRLDSHGDPTHFMMLENWNQFGELSFNKMKYWMDTSGTIIKGKYNLIRFFDN